MPPITRTAFMQISRSINSVGDSFFTQINLYKNNGKRTRLPLLDLEGNYHWAQVLKRFSDYWLLQSIIPFENRTRQSTYKALAHASVLLHFQKQPYGDSTSSRQANDARADMSVLSAESQDP